MKNPIKGLVRIDMKVRAWDSIYLDSTVTQKQRDNLLKALQEKVIENVYGLIEYLENNNIKYRYENQEDTPELIDPIDNNDNPTLIAFAEDHTTEIFTNEPTIEMHPEEFALPHEEEVLIIETYEDN